MQLLLLMLTITFFLLAKGVKSAGVNVRSFLPLSGPSTIPPPTPLTLGKDWHSCEHDLLP